MTVRTTLLGGTNWVDGDVLTAADQNDTFSGTYNNIGVGSVTLGRAITASASGIWSDYVYRQVGPSNSLPSMWTTSGSIIFGVSGTITTPGAGSSIIVSPHDWVDNPLDPTIIMTKGISRATRPTVKASGLFFPYMTGSQAILQNLQSVGYISTSKQNRLYNVTATNNGSTLWSSGLAFATDGVLISGNQLTPGTLNSGTQILCKPGSTTNQTPVITWDMGASYTINNISYMVGGSPTVGGALDHAISVFVSTDNTTYWMVDGGFISTSNTTARTANVSVGSSIRYVQLRAATASAGSLYIVLQETSAWEA